MSRLLGATPLLFVPLPWREGRPEGRAEGQASAPATPTYLTKTLNRISFLRGLRFSSCQTWVFQASTFREEGRCERKEGPGSARAWGTMERQRTLGALHDLGAASRLCPCPSLKAPRGSSLSVCLPPSKLTLRVFFFPFGVFPQGRLDRLHRMQSLDCGTFGRRRRCCDNSTNHPGPSVTPLTAL